MEVDDAETVSSSFPSCPSGAVNIGKPETLSHRGTRSKWCTRLDPRTCRRSKSLRLLPSIDQLDDIFFEKVKRQEKEAD